MEVQHSIKYAAQRAGITPHVIRAWEKRYHAVSPKRTNTNRRLYSSDDVERLRLLGILSNHGHRISDIAQHPTPTLIQLASSLSEDVTLTANNSPVFSTERAVDEALDAVRQLDADTLGEVLNRSALALGQRGILERLISPLTRRIGDLWVEGTMSAAHEHFASNILKVFLLSGARTYTGNSKAPAMIITTPVGQLHELGAAMIAAYARDLGWRVLYIGPSLPAADIAHVASANSAKAVILSIVHPAYDPGLAGELKTLRKLLPSHIAIIAGGESANAYADHLDGAEIVFTNDLYEFSNHLKRLRGSVSVN